MSAEQITELEFALLDPKQVRERTVEVELAAGGDGRTLDARIVPYGVTALVADPPDYRPYNEMFDAGAFARQVNTPGRGKVWLNFEHQQGIAGIVGSELYLHDRDDGLYGAFTLHRNADGDKALQLVEDGLLPGLSLEFTARSSKPRAGVVHRLQAHVDKVSLCRVPAYDGAEVLAVREAPELASIELDRAPPVDPAASAALTARLERVGVTPLGRMTTTDKPWDPARGRFSDDEWAHACLIAGADGPLLPVREPDGLVNVHALDAASRGLSRARAGHPERAAAARLLVRYYRAAGLDAPVQRHRPSAVLTAR